jgi:hypothetical protein
MTAAQLIAEQINAILKLAPEAGLYIGVKVESARDWKPHLDYAGEPMKPGEFRDPPDNHRELLDMLRRFLVPEACLNGTQMVPLHQDTVREIVEALEKLQALSADCTPGPAAHSAAARTRQPPVAS